MSASAAQLFDAVLDSIPTNADDCGIAVLGPVVWRPSDGRSARLWYFTTALPATGDFHLVAVDCGGSDHADAIMLRNAFMQALANRRPMVVHLTEDELQMARLCEVTWPGERIAGIRAQIEAEQAALQCVKF